MFLAHVIPSLEDRVMVSQNAKPHRREKSSYHYVSTKVRRLAPNRYNRNRGKINVTRRMTHHVSVSHAEALRSLTTAGSQLKTDFPVCLCSGGKLLLPPPLHLAMPKCNLEPQSYTRQEYNLNQPQNRSIFLTTIFAFKDYH